eukprot:9937477-Lingulodinium_polyedra.AAC.1
MEAMTEAAEKGRRATPASAGVPVGKGVFAHDHPDGGDKAWFVVKYSQRGAGWDDYMRLCVKDQY